MIGNVVSRVRTKIPSRACFLNLIRYKKSGGGRPPFIFEGEYRNKDGRLKYKLCTDMSYNSADGTKAYGAVLTPLKTHKPLLQFGYQFSDDSQTYGLLEVIGMVKGGLELHKRFPGMRGVLLCNDSECAVKHVSGTHVLQGWKDHSINKEIALLKELIPQIEFLRVPRQYTQMKQAHDVARQIRRNEF